MIVFLYAAKLLLNGVSSQRALRFRPVFVTFAIHDGGHEWFTSNGIYNHVVQNLGSTLEAFHSHRGSPFSRNDFSSLFAPHVNSPQRRRQGRDVKLNSMLPGGPKTKLQPRSFNGKFKLKTSWFPFWVTGPFVTFQACRWENFGDSKILEVFLANWRMVFDTGVTDVP